MTVTEYLGQISVLDERIDKELEKLQDMRARLFSSGIDYSKPRIQTSPKDSMACIYAEIDEQDRYINELIDDLTDLKSAITRQIEALSRPSYRTVLYQHYVEGLSLSEMSARTGRNRTTLYKVRDAALDDFALLYGFGR